MVEAEGAKFWHRVAPGIYRGDMDPPRTSLGRLLTEFGADVVIGHPTFRNERTVGGLLESGIAGALRNFPGQKVAFIVSDGTYRDADRDESTLRAALEAAAGALSGLDEDARANILIAATPYYGYGGDRTPGKGSALKFIYEELAYASPRLLILADGDLRNDMASWQDVYCRVDREHRDKHLGQRMFVTAAYERHFVDASLTRFIVGPLTTLLGCFVRGGISGDIALSADAAAIERGSWPDARRTYGTDIATTLDHLADEKTIVYEVYLGAKLHDITDEAKLSVMPEQVIGSALERILFHESRVQEVLTSRSPLHYPETWGPEETGIPFADPGTTDAFDIDAKIDALVERWPQFRPEVATVVGEEVAQSLASEVASLSDLRSTDRAPIRFLRVDADRWIDLLGRAVAYTLATGNLERASRAISFLYTAAFLEFCRARFEDLGLLTIDQVRAAQRRLGVPPERAQKFYHERVNGVATRLALDFYATRRRIKELKNGIAAEAAR